MSPTYYTDAEKSGKPLYRIWRDGGGGYVKIVFGKNLIGGGTNSHDRRIIHNALMGLYYKSAWMVRQCEPVCVVIHVRNGFHISPGENMRHITFGFEYARGGGASKHYHAYFDPHTNKILDITYMSSVFGHKIIEKVKES